MHNPLDKYVGRPYSHLEYNCWTFVCDVYKNELGIDLVDYTPNGKSEFEKAFSENTEREANENWEQINRPCDFSLILMKRSKGYLGCHVGIWFKGMLYHCHGTNFSGQVMANEYGTMHQDYKIIECYKHVDYKIPRESSI